MLSYTYSVMHIHIMYMCILLEIGLCSVPSLCLMEAKEFQSGVSYMSTDSSCLLKILHNLSILLASLIHTGSGEEASQFHRAQ